MSHRNGLAFFLLVVSLEIPKHQQDYGNLEGKTEMMEQHGPTKLGTLMASALLIAACGGGGGGGSNNDSGGGGDSGPSYPENGVTSAAEISDNSTAEDMSRAAAEGARKAKAQQSAPDNPLSGVELTQQDDTRTQVADITRELVNRVRSQEAAVGVSFTVNGTCSTNPGEAVYSTDGSSTTTPDSGSITYNDYCAGSQADGSTLNGTVTFDYTYSGSTLTKTEYSYNNVTVVDNATGETQTVNMSMVCTYSGSTASCTFSEAFTGWSTSVTYKIEDVTFTSTAPYDVSARIYHPTYGYVDFSTDSSLTYGCNNGMPQSGSIQFSDGNGNSVTVTFDSCSQISWTYQPSGGSASSGTISW